MRSYRKYGIDDFLRTTSYVGTSFSPDGRKVLVSSNATGIQNAYAIPIGGGEPQQLTYSVDDSILTVGYFPNDERFLYTTDNGGDGLSHVYVQTADGTVTDLTPGERVMAEFVGWAQDDRSFFIATNERDQRFFDCFEYDAESYEREMVYQNEDGYRFVDITGDRRYIALSSLFRFIPNDGDIYLYDRETGETKHLTPHQDDVYNEPVSFAADGGSLYYLTDKDREFRYLVRYDLASGAHDKVFEADWDISFSYLSKRGKYLVVGVNNDARTELRLYEAGTMNGIALPELPDAEISSVSISRAGDRMAFYATGGLPRDLFVYDFSGNAPVRLTRSLNQTIDAEDLVEGKVVRFESGMGRRFPAYSTGRTRRAVRTKCRRSYGYTAGQVGRVASALRSCTVASASPHSSSIWSTTGTLSTP